MSGYKYDPIAGLMLISWVLMMVVWAFAIGSGRSETWTVWEVYIIGIGTVVVTLAVGWVQYNEFSKYREATAR